MTIISFEDIKRLQVEMLCDIDGFCREKDIKYSLAFGTLLGAIRHKGYIPWDDDIDIVMPRPDYDKFLHTFNGTTEHLYVIAPEINREYYAPYANICDNRTLLSEGSNGHRSIKIGVKIDVFPVDGTPNDNNDYQQLISFMRSVNRKMSIKRHSLPYSRPKAFIKALLNKARYAFVSYSTCQQMILEESKTYPYELSKYVDTITFPVYKNTRVPKCYFSDYIDVIFEGCRFKVIKEYDGYLRKIYGDYMQLPSEDKRVPHHHFKAYWKD